MPNFRIVGEAPPVGSGDAVEMVGDIARYDLVTFEHAGPGEVHLRTVRPHEYASFAGTIYQIDRLQDDGDVFQLRQVRMAFFPMDDRES